MFRFARASLASVLGGSAWSTVRAAVPRFVTKMHPSPPPPPPLSGPSGGSVRSLMQRTGARSGYYDFGTQHPYYQRWYQSPKVIVWSIVGANVAVFGLWQLARGDRRFLQQMKRNFVCSRDNVTHGRVWTLLTATFSHFDFMHFFGNMFCVVSFGTTLCSVLGARRFSVLYLTSGVMGCMAHLITSRVMGGRDTAVLGASGSVMGLLTAFACMFPHERVYLYGIVGIPAWAVAGGMLALDLYSGLSRRADNISHSGHVGGAASGLLFYLLLRRGVRF